MDSEAFNYSSLQPNLTNTVKITPTHGMGGDEDKQLRKIATVGRQHLISCQERWSLLLSVFRD